MAAHFRFSEDDWKIISEPLQSRLGLVVQDDYYVPVRHLLEDAIDHWRLSDDDVLKRNEADCIEIWQAIINLRAKKNSDVGRRLIDSRFCEALDTLQKNCSELYNLLEKSTGPRLNRNDHRDFLITVLLVIWESHGGEARTSTASDNKTPSGPLIRFLIAVTNSLGIDLSPHAARKLVRKHREAAN
jgi:hypothetical protein